MSKAEEIFVQTPEVMNRLIRENVNFHTFWESYTFRNYPPRPIRIQVAFHTVVKPDLFVWLLTMVQPIAIEVQGYRDAQHHIRPEYVQAVLKVNKHHGQSSKSISILESDPIRLLPEFD